jgi:RimJ/RimL family protein N-acetyltransferase
MSNLSVKLLTSDEGEMRALQEVLEAAPDYSQRVSGGPPGPAEAQSLFSALPPEKSYDDKFVLGFYREPHEIIGCADVIRGYPNRETAMLGLLLLKEEEQGKGQGREAFKQVETLCLSWPETTKIRIGVVTTIAGVLDFWKKMGFEETGARRPFRHGSVQCETIVLEKAIR